MEKNEIARYFLRYLKSQNLYYLYCENFIYYNKKINWVEWSLNADPKIYVISAFSWASNAETWSKLDKDWHTELLKIT